MANEMPGKRWQKAISPERDAVQSRQLVWAAGAALLAVMVLRLTRTELSAGQLVKAGGLSAAFALVVWRMRAATGAAALMGGIICMDMALVGPMHRTALAALLTLFVLTFAATKFGRRRKEALGIAEARSGRRAAQIVANLGIAGLCAAGLTDAWFAACVAALAEATADTVSSEMGQALGGSTWMITNWRRTEPGVDGGVSLSGTIAGVVGAVMVAGVAVSLGLMAIRAGVYVAIAAVAGLIFDSVLGATVERRGWIGNDWVNFFSTAFAAGLAYGLTRWMAA
jgi:uncharacterized protein (TIGR00297 family)